MLNIQIALTIQYEYDEDIDDSQKKKSAITNYLCKRYSKNYNSQC